MSKTIGYISKNQAIYELSGHDKSFDAKKFEEVAAEKNWKSLDGKGQQYQHLDIISYILGVPILGE